MSVGPVVAARAGVGDIPCVWADVTGWYVYQFGTRCIDHCGVEIGANGFLFGPHNDDCS